MTRKNNYSITPFLIPFLILPISRKILCRPSRDSLVGFTRAVSSKGVLWTDCRKLYCHHNNITSDKTLGQHQMLFVESVNKSEDL